MQCSGIPCTQPIRDLLDGKVLIVLSWDAPAICLAADPMDVSILKFQSSPGHRGQAEAKVQESSLLHR
jgi:hypothetical protein